MTVEELLDQVDRLPSSPQIMPRLIRVIKNPDSSAEDIVETVNLDAAVTASLMRLANSSYFGFEQPSRDLEEAVSRLGMHETYRTVAALIGEQMAGDSLPAYRMGGKELWENSVAGAIAMETLAEKVGEDATECYAIGLFHNVGKILISKVIGNDYEEVFERLESDETSLVEAEKIVLGVDHVEAGVALLEQWGFPTSVTEPIAYQYAPMDAIMHNIKACMLHIAHYVVAGVGMNPGRDAWAFKVDPEALGPLALSENDLQEVMVDLHRRFEKVKNFLSGKRV